MSSPDLLMGPDSIDGSNVHRTANSNSSVEQEIASNEFDSLQFETFDQLLSAPAPSTGQTLQATPYPHQVGGHGQLKKTNNGTLLKPLYEKELRFYSYIHSERLPRSLRWLRHMTPKFYGETTSIPSPIPPSESAPAFIDAHRCDHVPLQWRVSSASSTTDMSPWALTMGARVSQKKSSHRQHATIALEDINQKFIFPSVLDCKIGVRHYDDDATEEKRRRHILKAEMTTSAKHGLRFTGMQSFKRVRSDGGPGVLEFRDKYYGRKLKGEDLVPEARWFFDNGVRVRTDCIKIILDKLEYLRQHVLLQTHFKFYSSSLLVVYEGASSDLAPCNADVRMIDFAHTQWVEEGGTEPDNGYILGIENLIRILKQVITDEEECEQASNGDHTPPVQTPASRSGSKLKTTKASSV